MALPSASDMFYRPAPPPQPPSRPAARPTDLPVTIDLTDLDDLGSDEWDFERVPSDSSSAITISSDSDSSVDAIVVTKHVKTRIKQFRKTRPKHDSRTDSEDIPAEERLKRFARKVAFKARSFLDTEAAHSGADSGDSAGAGDGYVSELIDDSPCSSESRAPSPAPRPVGHEIPTSKQRADCVRNQKKIALSTIIPALASPLKRSRSVMLTWHDPKSNKIRSKRYRCYDDIADESDGQAHYAYVPDVPQVSLSRHELKRKRTQRALAAHKKARAARKQR